LDWALAGLAMAIGGAIRWSGFHRQSLWVDEMSSYGLALQPFERTAANIVAVDAHPPGYIFLVQFFHYVFNLGIVGSVRAPSFLAGTLTIAIVYALMRVLVGRGAAVVAAALAVLTPMLVWYSREGRMYALTWMFVMLTLLALALAARSGKWRWLVAYAVCLGASLYADISAIMALVPQAVLIVAFLLRSQGEARRRWLRAGAAYLVGWALFIPWLLNLPSQILRTHGTFSDYPATSGTALRLLLNFTGVEATYALLYRLTVPAVLAGLMLAICALGIVGAIWLSRRHRLYMATVLTLTLGTAAMCLLLVAAGSPSVLLPRVMGLTVFGIILALAGTAELGWHAARKLPIGRAAVGAGVAIALLTSAVSLRTVEAHGYNGQNWRSVAAVILARAQPGDAVIDYPYGLKWMVDAYIPVGSFWTYNAFGIWQSSHPVAESWFRHLAEGHAHVFFVFYAADGIDAPYYDRWFQSLGYQRVSGDPTAGYGVLEYVVRAVPG